MGIVNPFYNSPRLLSGPTSAMKEPFYSKIPEVRYEFMQKKTGALLCSVIAALSSGGLALSLDFSSTETNISDESVTTTINEGDIFTTITGDIIEKATLAAICTADEIPESHVKACEEWNKP